MRQYLVTIPATAVDATQDVQVLVREFDSGEIEADFRSPAQQSVVWTPVGIHGGTVERA